MMNLQNSSEEGETTKDLWWKCNLEKTCLQIFFKAVIVADELMAMGVNSRFLAQLERESVVFVTPTRGLCHGRLAGVQQKTRLPVRVWWLCHFSYDLIQQLVQAAIMQKNCSVNNNNIFLLEIFPTQITVRPGFNLASWPSGPMAHLGCRSGPFWTILY